MKKIEEKMLVALLNAFDTSEEMTEAERLDAILEVHESLKKKRTIQRNPGEVFKLVPGTTRYYASNKGRILKMTSDGEAICRLSRSKNKTGRYYYDVYMDNNGVRYKCRVSRVIAKTWLDETLPLFYKVNNDKRVVDHITEDTLDNSLGNIQIIDQSKNIRRAIYGAGKSVGKECRKCYAEKNGVRIIFNSTGDLVRELNGNSNSGPFDHAVKNNHKLKGYKVGYID